MAFEGVDRKPRTFESAKNIEKLLLARDLIRKRLIPLRREGRADEAAARAAEREDLLHLIVRQFEIEDRHVLAEAFDARGARDRRHALLHQPAQRHLRRALAMRRADARQHAFLADRAARDRAIGNQSPC